MLDRTDQDLERVVRDIAGSLGVLDEAGELTTVDSLTLVAFLSELEARFAIQEIPPAMISMQTFGSIGAIATLVQRVRAGEAG